MTRLLGACARRWMAALVLSSLAAGSARAGPAEDKLLDCMRANIPPTLRIQEFSLRATDRAGAARVLSGRLFAKREGDLLRTMLKLTGPADLNGAAYLMREGKGNDEMYVFLPALNRVRRITGGGSGGSLFGTDLSYADIKQLHNAFASSAPAIEGGDKIDGRPVKILGVSPSTAAGSRYSRIRAWVDEASCVALRVDFMEGKELRKQLTVPSASLAKSGSYWYAAEAQMKDLKEGSHTLLKITGVKSGEDVANRYFDPRNFYLGG